MKQFLIVIVLSVVSQIAAAQWTFTSSVTKSGKCSGLGALEANVWAAIGQQLPGQVSYPTRERCESARAGLSGSYSQGGCTVHVTTTPCKGPAGASGGVNILGPSQGSSYYSTNPVNEINDWSKDDMERLLALNPEYNTIDPKAMKTGDIDYDG